MAIYAFFIVFNSSYPNVSGDDLSFYMSLATGGNAWHGLAFNNGRFFPLAGWNLNLISIFSTNPYALYFGNALIFATTAYFFYHIASKASNSKYLILILFIVFSLGVGYAKITTQIVFPELTQIMFLSGFLYFTYLFYANSENSECRNSQLYIYAVFAFIFGQCVIYLKEVSFVLIGGMGFFHILFVGFKIYVQDKNFKICIQKINKTHLVFDCALMISAIIFLLVYIYFTSGATSQYSSMKVFSITRTFVVSILAAPFVSIAMPMMLLYRIYDLVHFKTLPHAFWDSLLAIAFMYFLAFLVLGMASFHYFMPACIIVCLYLVFFLHTYFEKIKKSFLFVFATLLIGFILVSSTIPQGLHYFSLNKVQQKNINEGFEFLARYIAQNPNIDLYFDGFCRGQDKCYNSWGYASLFRMLEIIFNAKDFDIKSNTPNGKEFQINEDSKYTFFNSDKVSKPQSGDLIIVTYMSSNNIDSKYLQNLESENELIFKSNNFGYIPSYNLMSLGAWILNEMGIKHSLSSVAMDNAFKLPSQVYIYKVP